MLILNIMSEERMKHFREILKTDDQWINKRLDNQGLSSLHPTREEAIEAAERMLKDEGGGELYINNDDGSLLTKVYVEPNNLGDPGE